MTLSEQLTHLGTYAGRDASTEAPPATVEVVGGQEPLVFEVDGEPGDEGLNIGAPGRPWADPHGPPRVAAVWEVENPRQAPVPRVGLAADESAMASEGVSHD